MQRCDAQAVEDFAVGGLAVEPVRIERPERGIGGIVEAQALVRPEDGDGGVELVEGRGMGLDVAVEFLLGLFERRHVDGEAGACPRRDRFRGC